jgi:hypothetical protein
LLSNVGEHISLTLGTIILTRFTQNPDSKFCNSQLSI